jgi:uncharacterized protein YodC (DUF2158 family)
MQHKFAVGSRVRLSSGGPKMVIFGLGDGIVWAMWMDEQQHLQRDSFVPEVLDKVATLNEVNAL